jgi:16S rRNA (guanine527-N7)-methyltransferase
LGRLRDWLGDEAVAGGGLGPKEAENIEQRHLVDSVLFAGGWPRAPRQCWDLGSGAGLPGLVLACIWPGTDLILVDSSARKCDLARRGARVVGLDVEVHQLAIETLPGPYEAVVSRAAIPADRFRTLLGRLLAPGGRAVVSGTRGETPEGFERLEIPGFLDQASRLLMMRSP